ncbi:hypothetical protein B0H19DRAFT_1273575 [Mycena capillaripes]|nr:hypothetical protein B0H19DRAFT_1273575 [Mycena capillaripes]
MNKWRNSTDVRPCIPLRQCTRRRCNPSIFRWCRLPVHRAILAFVSPVFRDMFALPQPATEPEIPVISVQENSSVLDRALRFFYPGEQPAIGTLDELREVIEVLISKYDVQCVISAVKH